MCALTVASRLDFALAEYAKEAPLFDGDALLRVMDRFPEQRAALLRYAFIQLSSVPASSAEIAAEQAGPSA